MPSLAFVIVAAGSSRRMGFDKLASDLAGRPVLAHAIAACSAAEGVEEIWVVTRPERFEWVEELVSSLGLANFSGCIAGGKQRHDSVAAGISRVSSRLDLIAVHDAARPLVTPAAIERCALRAMDHGAASLAHRVVDTVKRTDSAGQVEESISRENLWAMETPQIFQRELLISAYDEIAASGESVTDEVSAIQTIGRSVSLEENSEPNLKVTIPGDLVLAEAIIKNRTGSGLFRN